MVERRLIAGAALFAMTFAAPLSSQPLPLGEAARLFGARETHWGVQLSPSGRKIAYLEALPGKQAALVVLDLAMEKTSRIVGSRGETEQINWCGFESDEWLICEYGGNIRYDTVITSFSRLMAIKSDGSKMNPLGRLEAAGTWIYRHDGAILDWLPDKENRVLMARNGVEEMDITTLRTAPVDGWKRNASHYLTDGAGNLRIMAMAQYTAGYTLTGITIFMYRPIGGSNWRDLGRYDSTTETGIWPAAVDRAGNAVYVFEARNGRDALYSIALDGSGKKTLVGEHPKVEIDRIVRLGHGRVIGYSLAEEKRRTVFVESSYAKLAASLARAMPKSPLVEFVSASRDEQRLLLHASADTDPGTYYLLDRATNAMRPVLLSRDPLEGRALAPVRAVSYRAADGAMIPAYVTMSADGPAKGRAAVVLPHGGPSARDEWGFDWLPQFLAARGYVVIQPNFRGSDGYGADHLGDNAFKQWRRAMSDIDDAASYLVTEGIADPQRLAIVGWSYGGYAALQSVNLYPSRYRAAVAIAPVTDLSKLKADSRRFTNSKLAAEFIGKGEHIRAGSPLANAARIQIPVLLVHGDMDSNVVIHHSDDMSKALAKAGNPAEYLRFKGLEHDLDDSLARTEMLTRMGQLLDRTIGR